MLSISIHAPAKGATAELLDMAAKRRAFQSTLPRRERRTERSRRPRSSYFNPRSREGSDPRVLRTRRHRPAISIHAPAKGATSSGVGLPDRPEHFNPRSREGSDTATSRETFIRLIFQSTLPRRERLLPPERTMKHRGFQSTLPRRERRHSVTIIRDYMLISIHAPAKGATFQLPSIPCA